MVVHVIGPSLGHSVAWGPGTAPSPTRCYNYTSICLASVSFACRRSIDNDTKDILYSWLDYTYWWRTGRRGEGHKTAYPAPKPMTLM